MRSLIVALLCLSSTSFALALRPPRRPLPAPPPAKEEPRKLEVGRIDFQTMNVNGQGPKRGAVELHDRKLLENSSMVKTPDNFRSALYDELR